MAWILGVASWINFLVIVSSGFGLALLPHLFMNEMSFLIILLHNTRWLNLQFRLGTSLSLLVLEPLNRVELVYHLAAGKLQFQTLKSHTLSEVVSWDHICLNSLVKTGFLDFLKILVFC